MQIGFRTIYQVYIDCEKAQILNTQNAKISPSAEPFPRVFLFRNKQLLEGQSYSTPALALP